MEKKPIHVKSFLLGILFAVLAAGVLYFVLPLIPGMCSPSSPDSLQAYYKSKEVEDVIRTYYLDDIDEQNQTDYMYLGMVAGLGDQFSTYYTKEEFEEVSKSQEGTFEGIGITIMQDSETGELKVVSVEEDSPAEKAGVQEGDVILSINGVSMTDAASSDAVSAIQGVEGEPVVLEISREGEEEPLTFEMEKAAISQTSAAGKMLENKIGYIQITGFTKLTPEQFADAYADLQDQGMKSLIIDLRDNPGGLVDSACDILEQIQPEGIMVYSEDKNGERKERTCDGDTPIDVPMVVLVNGSTASAAEIMAGAIKDYEIGTIVGTTTYGKGIIQNSFQLTDGSVLRLTVAHYYTPKGNDIHKVGIQPDVEVEQPEVGEEDEQLSKAIEILSE